MVSPACVCVDGDGDLRAMAEAAAATAVAGGSGIGRLACRRGGIGGPPLSLFLLNGTTSSSSCAAGAALLAGTTERGDKCRGGGSLPSEAMFDLEFKPKVQKQTVTKFKSCTGVYTEESVEINKTSSVASFQR